MSAEEKNPEEGQRVGAHPLLVLFGVILGLWLFIQFIIPDSKDIQPPQGGEQPLAQTGISEPDEALVPIFSVKATIPGMNAVSLVVPPKTTDSQIIALLYHLHHLRQDKGLSTILPPTNPEDPLDAFSLADIYIFSDPEYAVDDAIRVLAVGAHAPGEFYSPSIPYEVAMERVRGHYTINANNKGRPEKATLGFGEEETGLYSRAYRPVF